MKKQIKYAIYAMLVSVAIMLGNLAYWFQYYNLFSMQKWIDSFMKAVDMIFFGGFNFVLWSRGQYPAGNIAVCAVASAAILAFFWTVETRLFKDKKWAFLTAPLISSALLLFFTMGGSIVGSLIGIELSGNPAATGCNDIFYNSRGFDSFIILPANFSMLILETALAVFLSLILYGAAKKKSWNKFLFVSALLLILAQLLYFFILPLALMSFVPA